MYLKPHNKKAVDAIKGAYENGAHSVLYESGVGTGKSFVFMGLASDILNKGQKVLYIAPKNVIEKNLKKYDDFQELILSIQVDFRSFNYFTSVKKGLEELSNYDLVVIDEAHHLWGEIYGTNIFKCMEELPNIKFLGLTATPVRDINDGGKKTVYTKDLFDTSVYGVSNFEAIRQGLMPIFNYRVLMPSKDPEQLKKEYENQVDIRVDYTDCEDTLLDIIKTFERKKWIVFFSDIKSLHKNEELVKRVFDGYQVFILYSNLRNLDEVIDGVAKAERAVVLSVDMLLEGVHLPDITGIVLFRNVTSLTVFQQILGRVCSIGNTVEPLIVDATRTGPKMLAKLYAMELDHGVFKKKNLSSSGNAKPILTLGIDAETEWIGIESFLKKYTSLGKKMTSMENLEKAVSKYTVLNGKIYPDLDSWKKDKLSYQKLIACARCFEVGSVELLMNELRKAA